MSFTQQNQHTAVLTRLDSLERQVAELTRRLDEWTGNIRDKETATQPAKTLSLKRGQ